MQGIITAQLPWLLYDERFAPVWKARADAVAAAYQSYVTEHNLAEPRQRQQQPSGKDGAADLQDARRIGEIQVAVGAFDQPQRCGGDIEAGL